MAGRYQPFMSWASWDFPSIKLLSILCLVRFNTLNIQQVAEDEEKGKSWAIRPTVLPHLVNSVEACFAGFGVDFDSKQGP